MAIEDTIKQITRYLQESGVRVIAFGENHDEQAKFHPLVIRLLPFLASNGYTHLCVEQLCVNQEFFDDVKLELPGIRNEELRKRADWLSATEQSLICKAWDLGLRVVAVDTPPIPGIAERRDSDMADRLNQILQEDPLNKVLFIVGSIHAAIRNPANRGAYKTAMELVSDATGEKAIFSVAQVCQNQGHFSRAFSELDQPILRWPSQLSPDIMSEDYLDYPIKNLAQETIDVVKVTMSDWDATYWCPS